MKIIFALESFFPQNKAGTEIYVLNLAKGLRGKGYHISFIVPYRENAIVNDYLYEEFKVFTFPISNSVKPKEANGLIPTKGLAEFLTIVKTLKPDIVHFHSFGRAINYYHLLAVKEFGIRTVFTPHLGGVFCVRGDFEYLGKTPCNGKVDAKKCFTCSAHSKLNNVFAAHALSAVYTSVQHTPIRQFFPPAWQAVEHRGKELKALKSADAIISLSPWIKETLKLNGLTDNVHLVLQGLQYTFETATSITDKTISKPVIGYVGRIYPVKGIEMLLKAFRNLEGKVDLKILTMAPTADDDYYTAVRKQFLEEGNITWLEDLPQDEFVEEYKKIDVLCVPSLHEMAPLVVQEAAALKIPVLGSSIQAITDAVTHNINGLIFESGNAADLSMQLERIVNEPDLLPLLRKNQKPVRTFIDVSEEMDKIYCTILNINNSA